MEFKKITLNSSKIRGYKKIFNSKEEAKEGFISDINHLINKHYENYRFQAEPESPHIYLGIYEITTQKLVSVMILLKKNILGVEYSEFGVSIVDNEFRGQGLQTILREEISNYAMATLSEGLPIYSSGRTFSAHSQLQIYNVKYKEDGIVKRVATPRGIFPFYIFEKENDKFFLEFHLLYDSWIPLGKEDNVEIFLPPITKLKKFWIFNPERRREITPIYGYPKIQEGNLVVNQIKNPNFCYFHSKSYWNKYKLSEYIKIINHEGKTLNWKSSKNNLFLYSDLESPNSNIQVIHIEKVNSFGFLEDIEKCMKSVNISLKVSHFQSESEKAANLVIMEELVNNHFVPSCMNDVLLNKQRIKSVIFSRWQNIPIQSKFELLQTNQNIFESFIHDSNIQGFNWPAIVQYLDEQKINLKQMDNNNLRNYFPDFPRTFDEHKDFILNSWNFSYPLAKHIQDNGYQVQLIPQNGLYRMDKEFLLSYSIIEKQLESFVDELENSNENIIQIHLSTKNSFFLKIIEKYEDSVNLGNNSARV